MKGMFQLVITILSSCEVAFVPIGEGIVQEVSSVEKNCRNAAQKVITEKEKGTKIKVCKSYSQTLQLIRDIFPADSEFMMEDYMEDYYVLCSIYDAGAFTQKIRLVIVPKKKKEIIIWAGKMIAGRIVSEDSQVEKAAAEKIKIKIR